MRILYYYWTQYDDETRRGGGVQVYLKNIINYFKNNKNVEIVTLNSGVDYSISGKLKIEKIFDNNCKCFKIVNSPILAPSKASFHEVDKYLFDEKLKKILKEFISKNGPFDVIHIQSLEGLSLKVLELKELFPKTKFILSLHNYFYFCPQVNLWKNDELNCSNYHNGKDCVNCLGAFPNSSSIKKYYTINTSLAKLGLAKQSTKITKNIKKIYTKLHFSKGKEECRDNKTGNLYADFRNKNVEYINRYVDFVLCVSERVRDIAISMGINGKKAYTSYIGTQFAKSALGKNRNDIFNRVFGMAYMGYMRKDKGLYFLVDSLEAMEKEYSKNISITIAAKQDDLALTERIKKLKAKFKEVILYDGYTHNDIKNILKNVNLGIVPVLWEDNLPQVAIEFCSLGIPVLASNLGGPSELSKAKEFVFKAGNIEDFNDHVYNLIDNRLLLNKYFEQQIELTTMEAHCQRLLEIYNGKQE